MGDGIKDAAMREEREEAAEKAKAAAEHIRACEAKDEKADLDTAQELNARNTIIAYSASKQAFGVYINSARRGDWRKTREGALEEARRLWKQDDAVRSTGNPKIDAAVKDLREGNFWVCGCGTTNNVKNGRCFLCTRDRADSVEKLRCLNCNDPIADEQQHGVPYGYCSTSCSNKARGLAGEPETQTAGLLKSIAQLADAGHQDGLPEAYYKGCLLAIRDIALKGLKP